MIRVFGLTERVRKLNFYTFHFQSYFRSDDFWHTCFDQDGEYLYRHSSFTNVIGITKVYKLQKFFMNFHHISDGREIFSILHVNFADKYEDNNCEYLYRVPSNILSARIS